MTAHALASDREQCLASGMDDYLTKPFELEQLAEIVRRWAPPRTVPADADPGAAAGAQPAIGAAAEREASADEPAAVIDTAALASIRELDRDGSRGVLQRVVGLYLDGSPRIIKAIQAAAANSDSEGLRQAAHSLKSSSANLGAKRFAELCRTLEFKGRSGEWDGVPQLLTCLERDYAEVANGLHAVISR